MKLSAPIYHLKRNAKQLARQEAISLGDALNRIAIAEGYGSWSLLAARYASSSPAAKIYGTLAEGDLVLVGARPKQGKTLTALELAAEAVKDGKQGVFFTLDYTEADVLDLLNRLDLEPQHFGDALAFDCSDAICADYIIAKMQFAAPGTLVVVDYLQLLDQKRTNPPLSDQLSALQEFASTHRLVIIFISQIDRSYDPARKRVPDLHDVRLPNPMDLTLFGKTCFLNDGEVQFQNAG